MKKFLLALVLCLLSLNAQAGTSTRFAYIPVCGYIPMATENSDFGTFGDSATSGTMHCFPFVACAGISNATQIKFILGDTNITNSTTKIGVAIYDSSGNAVVRGTATYTSTDEGTTKSFTLTYPGTGTNFSLTDAAKYYQCQCSTSTSGGGGFIVPHVFTTGTREGFADFLNSMGSDWGRSDSGHRCDLGTALPPETMGTLAPITAYCSTFSLFRCFSPSVLKIGTSAP